MAIVANKQLLTIDAYYIKTVLIHYWRFERQMMSVDEYNSMDVAAIKDNRFIECEVKISKSDLLNDKKKAKHYMYKEKNYFPQYGAKSAIPVNQIAKMPNFFYFVVPEVLGEIALKEAQRINDNYGVIVICATSQSLEYGSTEGSVWVRKIARHLHTEKLDREYLYFHIGKRASAKLRILYGKRQEVLI